MRRFSSVLVAVLLGSVSTNVFAEDWVAERLRGNVSYLTGGSWIALERGQAVPDGGQVRTENNGHVELVRGAERIAMDSSTEITIRDAEGQQRTNVIQTRGSVTVEAERRNVQHFSVQTPVLAAVVKGTLFTVTYRNGQASVSVERGVVEVQDAARSMVADVREGQRAEASQRRPMAVSGAGAEDVTYEIEGEAVPTAVVSAVLSGAVAPSQAAAVAAGNAPPPPGPNAGPAGPASENRPAHAQGGQGPAASAGAGPGRPAHAGGPGGNGPRESGAGGNGPGNSGGNIPGNSGNAPGHGGAGPGNSDDSPGRGNDPGNGNGAGKKDERGNDGPGGRGGGRRGRD